MSEPLALSQRLRTETKALHTQAERTGIMGQLLRGRASLPTYAALLMSLEPIYLALEEGLALHAQHPAIGPLVVPGFARAETLASDLRALVALGVTPPAVAPDAKRYAAHLHELAQHDAPRLLAHAWLRYLGDLNGGQIIGRIVRESLALPSSATSFYEFPLLADPMAAAGAWRVALDDAPLDAATQTAIVDEAIDGFRRHIALFASLVPPGETADQDAADSSSAA